MKHFILENLSSIFKYFWVKILLTIPIGYFVFNEEHYLVIYALLMVLILDTILGIWVSIKYRVFTSHRLRRITAKMGRYSIGLASVWILTIVAPSIFGWSFKFFGVFFIMTEVFSNFEKLSLLGLQLPTKLLAKLNKHFYDFYFGEAEKKKEAVCKILSKDNSEYNVSPEDISMNKNIFDK